MPIYEYECTQCGVFEVMQKMSDLPLKTCDKCGAAVSKKISLTQFSLKGTGWYSTDYKSKPAEKSKSEPAKSENSKPGCGQGACTTDKPAVCSAPDSTTK